MRGCNVLPHPPSAPFYLPSRVLLPVFVVLSGKICFLASVSSTSQGHSSLIPSSLCLDFLVWVTLPTPHTPSSFVQKLSIQFYTRPHPSVNLSVLFFFSRDIPPRATHNYCSTRSPCCPSLQHSCWWALPSPAVLGPSAYLGLRIIVPQHLFFRNGFE